MRLVALFLGVIGFGTIVYASADDDIMARQALMKQVGAAAKARDLAALAVAGEQALVAFQADTTGQGSVETKAADAIWADWAGFEGIMTQMITAAKAGDADTVFGTCKTCHTSYRN